MEMFGPHNAYIPPPDEALRWLAPPCPFGRLPERQAIRNGGGSDWSKIPASLYCAWGRAALLTNESGNSFPTGRCICRPRIRALRDPELRSILQTFMTALTGRWFLVSVYELLLFYSLFCHLFLHFFFFYLYQIFSFLPKWCYMLVSLLLSSLYLAFSSSSFSLLKLVLNFSPWLSIFSSRYGVYTLFSCQLSDPYLFTLSFYHVYCCLV